MTDGGEVLAWINDNIRPVYLDEEPWWAPIEEVMESADTWAEKWGEVRAENERLRDAIRQVLDQTDLRTRMELLAALDTPTPVGPEPRHSNERGTTSP